jgi:hypothetical protein
MDMRKFSGEHFVKVADVRDGPIRETIAAVRMGKWDKPDLVFMSGDILSLNVTNTGILRRAYGDDSDGWLDKHVELFLGEIEYQNKPQEAVTVRPVSPAITAADRAATTKKLDAAAPAPARDDDFGDEIPF